MDHDPATFLCILEEEALICLNSTLNKIKSTLGIYHLRDLRSKGLYRPPSEDLVLRGRQFLEGRGRRLGGGGRDLGLHDLGLLLLLGAQLGQDEPAGVASLDHSVLKESLQVRPDLL